MRDSINLVIEAFEKATLIVTCDTPSIQSNWCIKYSNGVISDLKSSGLNILLNSGTYEIEFSDVIGYNKPDNYICFLKAGQTKKINISYTKKLTSDLQISFTIPALYQKYLSWKLTQLLGTTIVDWSHDINYKENLPNGKYQLQIMEYISNPVSSNDIQIYDINGVLITDYKFYIKGETYNFDLLQSTSILRTYNSKIGTTLDPPVNYGTICCTINPEKAKPFIKWKLTTTSIWFESGQNVLVPYGTYYLQTTAISGWTVSRKEDSIIVDSNKDIILIGIKAEQNGNLRVKLETKNIKDSARWRPVNTSVWYMDNEEISLYPNTYEIEFKPVEDYATPINQFYKIYEDEVYIFTNTYYHLGSLQINIDSNLLLESFGEPLWRIKSINIWRRTGEIIYLAADTYTIEFNTVGNVFTHEDLITTIVDETTMLEEIEFIGVNLFVIPTKTNVNFYNFNNLQRLNLLPELLSFVDTNQVVINYNDTLLAIAHNNVPYLTIYNLINYELYYDKQLVKPLSGCRSLDFSKDGKYLAVSHNNFPYLTVYNTSDWTQIEISSPPTNYCNTVKFSPNSVYLVVGFDKAPFIKIYYTPLFTPLTITQIDKEVLSCQFDTTNRYLGIGCYHTAYIYNINFDLVSLDVHGTIYGVEFFNNYLVIISSLYFYIYHYKEQTTTYVEDTKISVPIPNINNYITMSPDQKYLIIGCVDNPYVVIYETTNWTQVAFDGSLLNYCKKMVISGDLSLREYVNIPTNKYPINKYKGLREFESLVSSDFSCFSMTYTVSGDDLLSDTHIKSQWRLLDENEDIIYDSDICDDLTSHLIPESYFDIPKDYYWQVRHKGQDFGWSYWSKITSFSVVYSYIKKPINLLPLDEAIDVIEHPILTSSNFESINATDTHTFSVWRIYQRIQNLDILKFTSGAKPIDLTTFTVPEGDITNNIFGLLGSDPRLEPIEYVWQVRHKGELLGWSDWSDKTSFTTGEWKIEKPVNISPYINETDINENNLILTSSEFTVLNADDTHIQTRVEIYTIVHTIDRNGVTKDTEYLYYSYLFDDDSKNVEVSYQVPAEKLINGQVLYKWRIAYKGGQLGWSEWSDSTYFTTRIAQTSSVFVSIYPSNINMRWRWKKNTLDSVYSSYINPTYTTTYTEHLFEINTPNYTQIPSDQSIKINFESYLGYAPPADIFVDNLLAGQTYLYNANYISATIGGQIQCNITDNLLGNAKWRLIDTDIWRNSGYIESNLVYDFYDIEFKDVTGYTTPTNISNIIINSTELIIKTATYIVNNDNTYYVIVNIDHGQWRLNSELDVWYDTGDRVSLFGKSVESIVFSDVDGYITPNDITFQVPNTYESNPELRYNPEIWPRTLSYVRSYSTDNIGQLRCYLSPGYAKWKISTATTWNNTASIIDNIAGTYTVRFEKISGYKNIPDVSNVIVTSNALTTVSKVYELEPDVGSFRMWMFPANGGFRLKDTTNDWHQSDAIIPAIPVGTYNIEFKTIDNYITPKDLTVEIKKDELKEVTVLYKEEKDITKYIQIDVEGIDYKTNLIYWRANTSYNKTKWSDWTAWVEYYRSAGISNQIQGPSICYYKIEMLPPTGYTVGPPQIVEFIGESKTVNFKFTGSTTGSTTGKVNLVVNLLDKQQVKVTLDSGVYGLYLEFQHVEISDIVYADKDVKSINWDGKWIKYADSINIFTNLSTSKKHVYRVKPINTYFNLGEYGNISFIDFKGKTEVVLSLSFMNYVFTTPNSVYFGLPYLKNGTTGFTTPVIPDVSDFNIKIRTKSEYDDNFSDKKNILINGHVVTYVVGGITYQLLVSNAHTLIELFGVNQLGYISINSFGVAQTGTTTTMLDYTPKTLIYLDGLNLSAVLIPIIGGGGTTNPTIYKSLHSDYGSISGSGRCQIANLTIENYIEYFRVFIPPGTLRVDVTILEWGGQKVVSRHKIKPVKTFNDFSSNETGPRNLSDLINSDQIIAEDDGGRIRILYNLFSDPGLLQAQSGWLYVHVGNGGSSSSYYNKVYIEVDALTYNTWYNSINWPTAIEGVETYTP